MSSKRPKTQITSAQRFDVFRWLEQNAQFVNGKSAETVSKYAADDLKFPVSAYIVKTVIEQGKLDIKLKDRRNNLSPFNQLFKRVQLLESAYIDLCNQVGAKPVQFDDSTEASNT